MLSKPTLLLLTVVVALVAAACGSGGVVASVDDEELSRDELVAMMDESIPIERRASAAPDTTVAETIPDASPLLGPEDIPAQPVISEWIIDTLVELELERLGITLTAGDFDNGRALTSNEAPDNIVQRAAGVARVALELADIDPPTPEAIDQFLATSPPPGQTCVSHILLDTEADAQEVLGLLDDGGDFAELAVEFSVGPSGPTGGDLGCVGPGQFVEPFEAAMNQAETGSPLGPVETEFGFHVILVTERIVGEITDASRVAARSELFQADIDVLSDTYAQFLVDSADRIDVDPRYGTWSTVDSAVVAPEAADPPGVDATTTSFAPAG